VTGDESPAELEERVDLRAEVEAVRLAAGELMGLGDVSEQTVPKMFLLSPPRAGGAISTRAFIPSRVHSSIGVLMAASVAAGISIPGAVGADLAQLSGAETIELEHPSGSFPARVRVSQSADGTWSASSTSVRTARKLYDGVVFPRPCSALIRDPDPPASDSPTWTSRPSERTPDDRPDCFRRRASRERRTADP
jgi:4-oxalomesaconate tautomerase